MSMLKQLADDKTRVLEHLRTTRKFMPYLHESMSAHSVVELLGSRDRAQRALVALVQDRKITYLENCSPDHYQAYAADLPPCPTLPRTWALPEQPEDGTRMQTPAHGLYVHYQVSARRWAEMLLEHGPMTEVVETEVEAAIRRMREDRSHGRESSNDDVQLVLAFVLNKDTP
jgi:hypothetical protein